MKSNITLIKLRDLTKDETAPPQVIAFLSRMEIGKPIDREELGELAKKPKGDLPVMVTRQSADRVIAYYQPRLVTAGILKEERSGKNNIVARQPKTTAEPSVPGTTKAKDEPKQEKKTA